MEKTVVKALMLLETLAAHGRPRRVSELGRELGMAKSNVHRLLRTLVQLGFARQDGHGLYEPSLKSWELGVRVLSHVTVQRVAGDHLKRLAASSTEQVNLAIRDGAEVLYVAVVEAAHAKRADPVLGRRAPLHSVAAGKAILAYQPDAVIRAVAKPLVSATRRSIASGEQLQAELAEVRRRGFAMNLSEWRNGMHGVAAPIAAPDGQIVAAVSIAGPAERLRARRLRTLGPAVVETAGAIALDLAYASAGPEPVDAAPAGAKAR
jgi:IclR family transcriptional regulator, KDG regulon repressor